jgi:Acetoacetate decarboxylase (ADC)
MATEEVTLPRYVEYGGRATAPGAFECTGGRFRGFGLKGDHDAIKRLVDLYLNEPARGDVAFRAPTGVILLQIGWFAAVRATTEPFDQWGTVREVMATFWIPLVQGTERHGIFIPQRFVMACPFIWVDNPMSYAGGRETYGYPKSLGQFEFTKDHDADTLEGRMVVKTFGGQFDTNAVADWHPVVEITPPKDGSLTPPVKVEGTRGFMDYITEGKLDPDEESMLPDEYRVPPEERERALNGDSHQIFLKQFRDASDPGGACYQAIVHAPINLASSKTSFDDLTKDSWSVKVHALQSHPVLGEIGVGDQDAFVSYSQEMDFTCERGEVIAPQSEVRRTLD